MKNENKIMKGVLFGTLLLAACSLLLVTGCDNPVASGYKNIPDGQGTVTLKLTGAGRTIIPTSMPSATHYDLYFVAGVVGTNRNIIQLPAGEITDAINLDVGIYTLTIYAKDSEGKEIRYAIVLDIEVNASGNTPVNIGLKPIGNEGTGTFSWDIVVTGLDLDDDYNGTITIEKVDGNGSYDKEFDFVDIVIDPDTEVSLSGALPLASGEYTVKIELVGLSTSSSLDEDAKLVWEEYLYVFKNLTSKLELVGSYALDAGFFKLPLTQDVVLEVVYDLDENDWVPDATEQAKLAPEYAWEQGVDKDDPSYDPGDPATWIPIAGGNLYYIYPNLGANQSLAFRIPEGWKYKALDTNPPPPNDNKPINNSISGLTAGATGLQTVTGLSATGLTHLILEYDEAIGGGSLEYRLILVPTVQYYVVGATPSQQVTFEGASLDITFPANKLNGDPATGFVNDPGGTITITVADTLGISVASGTSAPPTISSAPGAGSTTVYTLNNNSNIFTVTVYEKQADTDVVDVVDDIDDVEDWIDDESLPAISENYAIEEWQGGGGKAIWYIASKLAIVNNQIKVNLPGEGWEFDPLTGITGSNASATVVPSTPLANGVITVTIDPTDTVETLLTLTYGREVSSGNQPEYYVNLVPQMQFNVIADVSATTEVDTGIIAFITGNNVADPGDTLDIPTGFNSTGDPARGFVVNAGEDVIVTVANVNEIVVIKDNVDVTASLQLVTSGMNSEYTIPGASSVYVLTIREIP